MDHLLAIRTFQRIVETHSFTKAAAHIGLPRSTVSKMLRELEAHLGIKLLQRTTRSITLTTEGAEYYRKVSKIVAKLDETEGALRDMGAAAKGRLRIDLHSSLANFVLLPILEEFRERYPRIQLALGIGDRPVNLIATLSSMASLKTCLSLKMGTGSSGISAPLQVRPGLCVSAVGEGIV